MTTATPIAPTEQSPTDLNKERLRLATEALGAIDLRTLKGDAKPAVKEAREAVRTALKAVRATST